MFTIKKSVAFYLRYSESDLISVVVFAYFALPVTSLTLPGPDLDTQYLLDTVNAH